MIFSFFNLVIALAALTCFHIWRCLRSPLSLIPGPVASNFTSLSLWWNESFGQRTLHVHSLHVKYGPVVRIAPGEVSFTSYDALKEIYGSQGSGYDKTGFYNLFTIFGRRTMFSTLDKVNHARRKRFLADRYANSNVVKTPSLDGIRKNAVSFVDICKCAADASVDIYSLLHSYACDCITHHIFHPHGTDSLHNEDHRKLMHQVTSDNSLACRLIEFRAPTLYPCFSRLIHMVVEQRRTPLVDDFVKGISSQKTPSEFTLLARLQEKLGIELDETTVAAECLDHMVAGIDTTGDALCFLMWELSQSCSLKHQIRLRDELLGSMDLPFDKLPFLDAVVQEGLRCFPAIPMSLPRSVPQGGKRIDGYFIPEGSVVSSQAYSVHRNNVDVFPDPELFDPNRWLAIEGDTERRRHMLAFSYGGRGCVGKQ